MDPLSHPEDASGPARHHWGSVGRAPRRPSAGATEAQEGAAGPAVSQDGATQLPGPAASSAREEGSVLISGPWEPRGAQSIPVPPPGPRQAECWGFRAPPGGGGPGHQSRKCGKWFSAGKVCCGVHQPRHVAVRIPSSESPCGWEGSCSLSEARIQDRPDRTACAHARKGPGCPHGRDTS